MGLAAIGWGLPLLAGCSGLAPAVGNDPLLGGPPVRSTPQPAAPVATQAAVLPPPAANQTLSNAVLASAAPRSLDGNADLRIGAPRTLAAVDGWSKEGTPSTAPANPSGVQLRPPEPVTGAGPHAEVATVSSSSTPRDPGNNPASADRLEQAFAQIKARGALAQSLVMVAETGEWKYSCLIPNRQNPRLRRNYEGRATDAASAIRAVLDQLDKEP